MKTISIMKDGRPATHKELCKAAGIPAHTPGPWRVAPACDYNYGVNVDAYPHPHGGYVCLVGSDDNEQAKIDALLIAAAPELLYALKSLEKVRFSSDIAGLANDVRDLVNSAIAKAEGATQ